MSKRHICIGIHIGHDRSVSLVENGVLAGHLAEERIDRVKHSSSVSFPRRSLDVLLRNFDCNIKDVDAFAITYGFVDMKILGPSLIEDFKAEFCLPDANVFCVGHHLAHAYSAFFTSPFHEATVLVADGAGDLGESGLEAETAYHASAKGVAPLWMRRQDIPTSYGDRRNFFRLPYMASIDQGKQISFGRKYEQFTYALGFGWGQSGKTMGLAAWGKPMFSPPDAALTPPEFQLSMSDMLEELDRVREASGASFGSFMRRHGKDIAATIQSAVEEMTVAVCRHLHDLRPSDNLCLAGGLFLNCVMNHKIIRETAFKNIHIVPACGDDGQSIGAAFYAYEQMRELPTPRMSSPYLGPSYGACDVRSAVEAAGLGHKAMPLDEDSVVRMMAGLIKGGRTVGLFRGRSEMGPRALGHRSILANPGSAAMRDHVNRYVKHREDFRPLAPMVRWEDQFTIFDLAAPSPHMLLTAQVRAEWRDRIPAVTHIDGSARVQAVRQEDEKFLHRLLTVLDEITGVPVLLNTSLNGRGEPIVETPTDALAMFLRSNLDAIVIENYLIER